MRTTERIRVTRLRAREQRYLAINKLLLLKWRVANFLLSLAQRAEKNAYTHLSQHSGDAAGAVEDRYGGGDLESRY